MIRLKQVLVKRYTESKRTALSGGLTIQPVCVCACACVCVCVCVHVCVCSESCSVMSDSLRPHGRYSPWNYLGQNTGVGSLSLLQGIFPSQGLILGVPLCGWILYQLNHKESPRILEWVAYPFSRRYSQARNPPGVSCIAGKFLTN